MSDHFYYCLLFTVFLQVLEILDFFNFKCLKSLKFQCIALILHLNLHWFLNTVLDFGPAFIALTVC